MTKAERLEQAKQLVYSDKLDLFAGIKNLTLREKELILEANYRRRLAKLEGTVRKEVLAELKGKLAKGVAPQDAVEAIRQEFGEKVEAEYLEEALGNMKRCLYSGWESETLEIRQMVDDEYKRELKSATPEKRKMLAPKPELAQDPMAKWELKPRVEQILSNREGYSGDFYSVFFGSRQDDVRFFEVLREGVQEGASVGDIAARAKEALLAPTTPGEVDQIFANLRQKLSKNF